MSTKSRKRKLYPEPELLTPIIVAPEWNDELDCEYAHSLWTLERGQDQSEIAFATLGKFRAAFARLLAITANFSTRWTDIPQYIDASAQSIAENIEFLAIVIAQANVPEPFRRRVVRDLTYCRRVEAERTRIISNYLAEAGKGWKHPLTKLCDRYWTAGFDLEQSFDLEIEDFEAYRKKAEQRMRKATKDDDWWDVFH